MGKKKHTPEQIIGKLREAEVGPSSDKAGEALGCCTPKHFVD